MEFPDLVQNISQFFHIIGCTRKNFHFVSTFVDIYVNHFRHIAPIVAFCLLSVIILLNFLLLLLTLSIFLQKRSLRRTFLLISTRSATDIVCCLVLITLLAVSYYEPNPTEVQMVGAIWDTWNGLIHYQSRITPIYIRRLLVEKFDKHFPSILPYYAIANMVLSFATSVSVFSTVLLCFYWWMKVKRKQAYNNFLTSSRTLLLTVLLVASSVLIGVLDYLSDYQLPFGTVAFFRAQQKYLARLAFPEHWFDVPLSVIVPIFLLITFLITLSIATDLKLSARHCGDPVSAKKLERCGITVVAHCVQGVLFALPVVICSVCYWRFVSAANTLLDYSICSVDGLIHGGGIQFDCEYLVTFLSLYFTYFVVSVVSSLFWAIKTILDPLLLMVSVKCLRNEFRKLSYLCNVRSYEQIIEE